MLTSYWTSVFDLQGRHPCSVTAFYLESPEHFDMVFAVLGCLLAHLQEDQTHFTLAAKPSRLMLKAKLLQVVRLQLEVYHSRCCLPPAPPTAMKLSLMPSVYDSLSTLFVFKISL